MAPDGSEQGFAPPARRTTYSQIHDNDFDAYAPKRTTTSNLEAQNPFHDPHGDQHQYAPTKGQYQQPENTYSQHQNNTHDQSQQYYAAMNPSTQTGPQTKTIFPPLTPPRVRKRFNNSIIIPSAVAVAVCVLIVALVVCYVSGVFGG